MNVGFTTDAQLQAHIKKEHANCPFCDRRCASQQALEKHIESQHSGTTLAQRKTIPCTYLGCTKTFTKKSNLTVHIRTAHNGERYICGKIDVSNVSDLSPFNADDGCGKDFVSKANLEDHVRTAHLGLPSLINSKRKKPYPIPEDLAEADTPRELKRGRKVFQQPSAFDDLTGATYDDDERRTIPCTVPGCRHKFMREYDLKVHLRTKQHQLLPASFNPAIQNQSVTDHTFSEFPEDPQRENSLANHDSFLDEGEREIAVELGGFYSPAFTDWDLQEQALAGEPFWIGADDGGVGNELQGHWMQEELEMRRLIDAGDSMYADHEMQM